MNKQDNLVIVAEDLKVIWEELLSKFPDGYNDTLHPKGDRVTLDKWVYDFHKFSEWAKLEGYSKGKRLVRRNKGGFVGLTSWTDALTFGSPAYPKRGGSPWIWVGVYKGGTLLHFEYVVDIIWESSCKAKKGKYRAFDNEVAVEGLSKLQGLSYRILPKGVGESLRCTDIWDNFHSTLQYRYGHNSIVGTRGNFLLTECSKCGKVLERDITKCSRRWWNTLGSRCQGCTTKSRRSSTFYSYANSHRKVSNMSINELVKIGTQLECS